MTEHTEHSDRFDKAIARKGRWDWLDQLVRVLFALAFVALAVVAVASISLDLRQSDNQDQQARNTAEATCRGRVNAVAISHALQALASPIPTAGENPDTTPRGRQINAGLEATNLVLTNVCATPAGRAKAGRFVDAQRPATGVPR